MNPLTDFYRNVTYFDNYDENSFVGRWIDYGEWSDDEYWKLEKSLLAIAKKYKLKKKISQEILIGLMRIIDLLMVSNWELFPINPVNCKYKDADIYDRFERLKFLISYIFQEDNDFKKYEFAYTPPIDE
ncbi:Imm41 family immunity protein [Neisseria lisongii]|uniref:Immunity 41 family protein n=1 Tax=Neisseria lisongii TaxID=2912188 RepID=A0AAW5ALS9_9NEIS|nr:Imm41 family immunity protein [Neisseria lisongii]MCF7530119.1 immunity 41 family protein [Neisseria lisongii]